MSGLLGYMSKLVLAISDDIAATAAKTASVSIDDLVTQSGAVLKGATLATKSAGAVLGDDIAAVSSVVVENNGKVGHLTKEELIIRNQTAAQRELPVIWKISKGSMKNKAKIVPSTLLSSAFVPILIPIALVAGGSYLSYEAAESTLEKLGLMSEHEEHTTDTLNKTSEELEKEKVDGAIATDFVLSLEIIIIAMNSISDETMPMQIAMLIVVAIVTTVGVYGIVGLIVKMDDVGFHLEKNEKPWISKLGTKMVSTMPKFLKWLGILGTVAMAIVGGSIIAHYLPFITPLLHILEELHWALSLISTLALEATIGLTLGVILVGLHKVSMPFINKFKKSH